MLINLILLLDFLLFGVAVYLLGSMFYNHYHDKKLAELAAENEHLKEMVADYHYSDNGEEGE